MPSFLLAMTLLWLSRLIELFFLSNVAAAFFWAYSMPLRLTLWIGLDRFQELDHLSWLVLSIYHSPFCLQAVVVLPYFIAKFILRVDRVWAQRLAEAAARVGLLLVARCNMLPFLFALVHDLPTILGQFRPSNVLATDLEVKEVGDVFKEILHTGILVFNRETVARAAELIGHDDTHLSSSSSEMPGSWLLAFSAPESSATVSPMVTLSTELTPPETSQPADLDFLRPRPARAPELQLVQGRKALTVRSMPQPLKGILKVPTKQFREFAGREGHETVVLKTRMVTARPEERCGAEMAAVQTKVDDDEVRRGEHVQVSAHEVLNDVTAPAEPSQRIGDTTNDEPVRSVTLEPLAIANEEAAIPVVTVSYTAPITAPAAAQAPLTPLPHVRRRFVPPRIRDLRLDMSGVSRAPNRTDLWRSLMRGQKALQSYPAHAPLDKQTMVKLQCDFEEIVRSVPEASVLDLAHIFRSPTSCHHRARRALAALEIRVRPDLDRSISTGNELEQSHISTPETSSPVVTPEPSSPAMPQMICDEGRMQDSSTSMNVCDEAPELMAAHQIAETVKDSIMEDVQEDLAGQETRVTDAAAEMEWTPSPTSINTNLRIAIDDLDDDMTEAPAPVSAPPARTRVHATRLCLPVATRRISPNFNIEVTMSEGSPITPTVVRAAATNAGPNIVMEDSGAPQVAQTRGPSHRPSEAASNGPYEEGESSEWWECLEEADLDVHKARRLLAELNANAMACKALEQTSRNNVGAELQAAAFLAGLSSASSSGPTRRMPTQPQPHSASRSTAAASALPPRNRPTPPPQAAGNVSRRRVVRPSSLNVVTSASKDQSQAQAQQQSQAQEQDQVPSLLSSFVKDIGSWGGSSGGNAGSGGRSL